MKVFVLSLASLAAVIFFSRSSLAEHIPGQRLAVGRATSVETDYNIGEVAVSNDQIVDFMITDSRREIYLNPKREGVITLTVWDAEGRKRDVAPVEVYKSDTKNLEEEAKALFSDTNIELRKEGKRLILSGDATSKVSLEQASSFVARYPDVENEVTMSKEVLQVIADRIEAAIGTPGIKIRNVRGRLVLEGTAYNSSAAKKAAEIAQMYEPKIVNLIDVKETGRRPGRDKMIRLDIYFVEMKKEVLRSFGINWAPGSTPKSGESGGGLGGIANIGTSIVGFAMNFAPKIQLLNEKGQARILDNASFIVKSGEPVDFFNGTQVPFYAGDSVTFKDIGVKVHAEPIAADSDVDLVINATISSPSANIGAGIDSRNISTSAYIRDGQAIVLANMVSNHEVKTYNKQPSGLDTSTALFSLALSKDFQSGRSEFFVFVKPSIVYETLPAEDKLREYLDTEKDMIRTRSKKEYRDFLKKNDELGSEAMTVKGKAGRKKW